MANPLTKDQVLSVIHPTELKTAIQVLDDLLRKVPNSFPQPPNPSESFYMIQALIYNLSYPPRSGDLFRHLKSLENEGRITYELKPGRFGRPVKHYHLNGNFRPAREESPETLYSNLQLQTN